MRYSVIPLLALSAAICLITDAPTTLAGESATQPPLLEAAQRTSIQGWQGQLDAGAGFKFRGVDKGWIHTFWDKHKWHMLTTFVMVETQYQYDRQVGTSRSPLLFGKPTSIDSTTDNTLYDDDASLNFIENNKTNLLQAVALGSIFGSHDGDWTGTVDDFMGLIEAEKFNSTSTELVKEIVGRRRPALDRADPSEMSRAEYDAIQASDAGHLSFYSAATSEAFTYCSYLDLVVARRLERHPRWRVATGMGLYGLAGYIGYSRLRQGEHYLTDVLAGAAAGTFVGRGFYKANHRDENGEGTIDETADRSLPAKSRFHFSPPMPVPGGGMLSMSVELGR